MSEDLRVLTVREPWATLIALGRKDWENRIPRVAAFVEDRPLQRIAIHAGQVPVRDLGAPTAPDGGPWPTSHCGHIVALVTVGKGAVCGPDEFLDSPWRIAGQSGIAMLEPFLLPTPVPFKGGQGWRVLRRADPDAWRLVLEQEAKRRPGSPGSSPGPVPSKPEGAGPGVQSQLDMGQGTPQP